MTTTDRINYILTSISEAYVRATIMSQNEEIDTAIRQQLRALADRLSLEKKELCRIIGGDQA